MHQIETDRLLLRRWGTADYVHFRKINADPKVMQYYPSVLNDEESDQIIKKTEEHFEKYGYGLFAVELKETNGLVGFVGLQNVPFKAHFTPAVEIGWRIASGQWNEGFATEAAKAVLKWGFETHPIDEIVAMTFKENAPSIRVMEKLGMHYDSKDDFDNPHPKLEGTNLKPHVLYRIKKELLKA